MTVSEAPPAQPQSQLDLYRAVMHRSLPTLRNAAPALTLGALTGSEAPPAAHYTPQQSGTQVIASYRKTTGRVLLIDDEILLARAYARTLKQQGLLPVCVHDAASAVGELRSNSYDVVVCDIDLPDHTGLELLRHVRNSEPDLPMILVTGAPSLETAIEAVTLGAFRYLVKPITNAHLVGCIAQARRTRHVARLREQTLSNPSSTQTDHAALSVALDRALEPLWIAYQPLISWPLRNILGYQALVRSDEPSLTLPSSVLMAANTLGRRDEVTLAVQRSVARTARALPRKARILLNTTATTLMCDQLYGTNSDFNTIAKRITLEIDNPTSFTRDPCGLARLEELFAAGYQFALTTSEEQPIPQAQLDLWRPQIVKYLASSANCTQAPELRNILSWCRSQGVHLVIEGVERHDERDALSAIGCEYFQDCLFDTSGR